ncbi:2-amino-4-hydroxy-6-hydroxymethyldihydropteridine diphosphokinase [Geothermobacter hydrogeniphilus]|uniref:2-amino-4-hydroxy-6-hydroxymethyldihydropteridine pyrophosphokinase n=1 Tax=Geothermobacter hydrogeniphilus TaxID=1969733 RepID=A0A1X0YAH4_9BACT|nr:2-amino-4-hydroxy-6-hydroxymethyldihydropteridine diphosphokinase [Geothermobacter hydrogeniphilus]ORJ62102.1 2-amino-4-hydroxy-6-hydroxymethyldihydropteridine diphosphokinase [Geothermobacter hydrogeniphilus]
MSLVFIGLGANLGDRLANLRHARTALAAMTEVQLVGSSRLYETEPVGGPEGQPAFFNAVLQLQVELDPYQLLERCQDLERACGRKRETRWGPRTLDIDLLLVDAMISRSPELELPHPRLAGRGFVLAPLLDLAPDLPIPGSGGTVGDLWRRGEPWTGIACRGDW